jgi:hypothetical protein
VKLNNNYVGGSQQQQVPLKKIQISEEDWIKNEAGKRLEESMKKLNLT